MPACVLHYANFIVLPKYILGMDHQAWLISEANNHVDTPYWMQICVI